MQKIKQKEIGEKLQGEKELYNEQRIRNVRGLKGIRHRSEMEKKLDSM